MKRIITLISTVLVIVSCSEDKIGGPVPEPGYDITLFQYKNSFVEGKIMVYGTDGHFWYICGKGEKESCLIALNKNIFLGNLMETQGDPENYAIIDKDWGTYSSSDKSFYSDDDILERQIFSRFYRIPRRVVPSLVEKFPISEHYPENIDFINAMIDDGSIEQYRVDLGY